jgi:hypothetical protein
MAESFTIAFVIIGVIFLIFLVLVGIAHLADFIWAFIFLAIGGGLLFGGISLLVRVGGPPGAFGIFMALLGGLIAKRGITLFQEATEKFGR